MAPGGAENTRWNTVNRHLCLRMNYCQFFGSWFSDLNGVKQRESAKMWRRLRNTHVLLHVRANGDCPVSAIVRRVASGEKEKQKDSQSYHFCIGSSHPGWIHAFSESTANSSETQYLFLASTLPFDLIFLIRSLMITILCCSNANVSGPIKLGKCSNFPVMAGRPIIIQVGINCWRHGTVRAGCNQKCASASERSTHFVDDFVAHDTLQP